jgi:hypothetical protein
MLCNHLNYYQPGLMIYCEKNGSIEYADQLFFDNNCRGCPYFNGHLQGEGIECVYENSFADLPFMAVDDPDAFMENRLKVRDEDRRKDMERLSRETKTEKSLAHVVELEDK